MYMHTCTQHAHTMYTYCTPVTCMYMLTCTHTCTHTVHLSHVCTCTHALNMYTHALNLYAHMYICTHVHLYAYIHFCTYRRGTLLSTAIFLYATTSPVNGYFGGALYSRLRGELVLVERMLGIEGEGSTFVFIL